MSNTIEAITHQITASAFIVATLDSLLPLILIDSLELISTSFDTINSDPVSVSVLDTDSLFIVFSFKKTVFFA